MNLHQHKVPWGEAWCEGLVDDICDFILREKCLGGRKCLMEGVGMKEQNEERC